MELAVYKILLVCTCLLLLCAATVSMVSAGESVADRESARQREEDERRLQALEDARPDVRLQAGQLPSSKMEYPEDETPCFEIREIRLEGDQSEKFQWALWSVRDAVGRCLGAKGVNIVMSRVQDALLKKGYTTTRIVAAPQNLSEGVLVLTLVPGIVADVYLSEDSGKHQYLYPVMPVRKGKILRLRDTEQGLENLRRIPSVQTDIKLVPGENEGESKMEIVRKQGRPVRVALSADDSGSEYTGKYQGTATLYLDNMLGMSDMFSASLGNSLETYNRQYGTGNYSLYYSIPWTYWQLSFYHSNHEYHQTVAGYDSEYEYSGESRNTSLELSRVLFRTAKSKTSASMSGWMSTSSNYIDDTEMEIQRRRMAGWELGVTHRQFLRQAVLDADLRYRRGTGALHALKAPEEETGSGTSRPEILTLNLRFTIPFKIRNQNFRFSTSWRQQWAFTKLIQKDRLSIGGRYTVRGYDGELTLSCDNGFVSRTELSYSIPKTNQELYGAFDGGKVWGPGSDMLLGRSLTGVALGLRGSIKNFSYDAYVSTPVRSPEGYPGKNRIYGFSMNLQF